MDLETDSIDNIGKRVSVELGTSVKIELEGIEFHLHSSIVGLENDKYLILKAPEPLSRIQHKLYPGNKMIIRYISCGTVYAFQTRMIETILKPTPLLFIEYPSVVQHHDLREQPRINCHVPTKINVDGIENTGCLVDMAKAGCRCIVQAGKNANLIKYNLECQVTLNCIFPGFKDVITIYGIVKNVKRNMEEYDLGVSFTDETPLESKKIISWFISTIKNFA